MSLQSLDEQSTHLSTQHWTKSVQLEIQRECNLQSSSLLDGNLLCLLAG